MYAVALQPHNLLTHSVCVLFFSFMSHLQLPGAEVIALTAPSGVMMLSCGGSSLMLHSNALPTRVTHTCACTCTSTHLNNQPSMLLVDTTPLCPVPTDMLEAHEAHHMALTHRSARQSLTCDRLCRSWAMGLAQGTTQGHCGDPWQAQRQARCCCHAPQHL